MYKMLVLDIDGTIVEHSKNFIRPVIVEALLQLQQQGIIVVLNSGRIVEAMKEFGNTLKLHDFHGYLIGNNGSTIYDCKTEEIIYESLMDKELLAKSYNYAKEHDLHMMMVTNNQIIFSHIDEAIQIEKKAIDIDFIWSMHLDRHLHKPIQRITYTYSMERLDEVEDNLRKSLHTEANVVRSQSIFLDVMNIDCDKAKGLEILGERTGITSQQMVACGDGGNDLGMILYAGMGVAMGNATAHVKAHATYVTKPVEDNGILDVIEQFFI